MQYWRSYGRDIMNNETIKAISLFSGAGIDEFYLSEEGVEVILANEIIASRAAAYKALHKNQNIVVDDISKNNVKAEIIKFAKENNVELIIATPPCQGVSWAGANKTGDSLIKDKRNFLILNAIEIFDVVKPNYFIIENVPRFSEMLFPINGEWVTLKELLERKYSSEYEISVKVFDAADYGVPQTRLRIVYRLWKKGLIWGEPQKEKNISLHDAIGALPSLEAGETSNINNHYARRHPQNHIECMRYTPSGKTAYDNETHFPKKLNGEKVKGFKNTFKRMRWDRPAPTLTMRNEIISSQENVHPGRLLPDGMWSDARVLTLRELLIVSSLPPDLDVPTNLSETAFRQIIGEGVPPKMFAKIIGQIGR